MRNEAEFVEGFEQLVMALDVNINWIREHTRLGVLAKRWYKAKGLKVEPLRSEELVAAERWLSDRPEKAPEPSSLHKAYIRESREA